MTYLPFLLEKPVTSPFGWRWTPFPGFHNGVDFGSVGETTPVFAVADGLVKLKKDWYGGLYVWQETTIGSFIYLHLSSFADDLKGGFIKKGTHLGFTGSSGLTFGPHLHFGLKQAGKWVDPMPELARINNFLTQEEMDEILENIDDVKDLVMSKQSVALQPLLDVSDGKVWVGGVYDATGAAYDAIVVCNYSDHPSLFTIGIRGAKNVWSVYGENNKKGGEEYVVAPHSSRIIQFEQGFGTHFEVRSDKPIAVFQRSRQT